MRGLKALPAAAIATGLAGCSDGGPGTAEIEKAFRSTAPIVDRTGPAFHDFKVRHCETTATRDVFDCEFSYMQLSKTEVVKARFSRSRAGWSMTDPYAVASYDHAR